MPPEKPNPPTEKRAKLSISPEELERRQQKLLAAALKGKDAFNAAWDEIFHPEKAEQK